MSCELKAVHSWVTDLPKGEATPPSRKSLGFSEPQALPLLEHASKPQTLSPIAGVAYGHTCSKGRQ